MRAVPFLHLRNRLDFINRCFLMLSFSPYHNRIREINDVLFLHTDNPTIL